MASYRMTSQKAIDSIFQTPKQIGLLRSHFIGHNSSYFNPVLWSYLEPCNGGIISQNATWFIFICFCDQASNQLAEKSLQRAQLDSILYASAIISQTNSSRSHFTEYNHNDKDKVIHNTSIHKQSNGAIISWAYARFRLGYNWVWIIANMAEG